MTDNLKVLIVEDNPNDADLLLRTLTKNNFVFTSEIVETQTSYKNSLDNFMPDIILSDFRLPAFDGITAFNIKQEKAPDIPFIIVSGTIGEERSIELIKNGVTDYALKNKLYTLPSKITRALKDAEEKKEKRITDEELKAQYDKLLKIAFMQSHQMRVPVANILGLFNLFNFDNPGDPVNGEVLCELKLVAESLDQTIYEIMANTSSIRAVMK